MPFEDARPLLDKRPYVVLSDYKTLNQAFSPQLTSTSIGMSGSPNKDDPGKAFRDEDEEIDFDLEGSNSYADNESDSEAGYTLFTDDLAGADIGDIMMDLNGSRVKFKVRAYASMIFLLVLLWLKDI